MPRIAPKYTPHLISTDENRRLVMGAIAGRISGLIVAEIATKAGLDIEATHDALHDLLALRIAKTDGAGNGSARYSPRQPYSHAVWGRAAAFC